MLQMQEAAPVSPRGQERGTFPDVGSNTPGLPVARKHKSNLCSLKSNAILNQAQIYFQCYFPALPSKSHSPLRPHLGTSAPGSPAVTALDLGKRAAALDPALLVAPLLATPLSLE